MLLPPGELEMLAELRVAWVKTSQFVAALLPCCIREKKVYKSLTRNLGPPKVSTTSTSVILMLLSYEGLYDSKLERRHACHHKEMFRVIQSFLAYIGSVAMS